MGLVATIAARLPGGRGNASLATLLTNIFARLVAIACVALATLFVARTEGAAGVGSYALLRVLPGLLGVVISCGLPGAVAYFLAGTSGHDRRLPLTITAMALVGGAAGTALWLGAAPVMHGRLFPGMSGWLVGVAGTTVLTQLIVATAKSCSQGSGDMRGANIVIVNEEFMFLPIYGMLWATGDSGRGALVAALIGADVVTFAWGWSRLSRRGFFRGVSRPSLPVGLAIATYGLRAQIGGIMTLLNLRLDFIILNLIAGPAVLGVYAIASKFAELVKVPGLALTYVLYPRYSRDDHANATAAARRLMPKAGLTLAVAVIPLWIAAGWLIPVLYGPAFGSAVTPARIILAGLVLEGVAGVLSAYLYGVGRPGLNSWSMAAGLAVTVVLDIALIPRFGSIGAAVTSAIAYIVSTLALMACFWSLQRRDRRVRPLRGVPRPDPS